MPGLSSNEQTELRFGILGTANIARKNIRAISLATNCRLVAIASRNLEKARRYSESMNLSKKTLLYGSYEELLNNPDIDAVYIPLPTLEHLKWVSIAATKRKHILLEKPCAVDADMLNHILEFCRESGVFFMDGVMFNHHPRMRSLLRELNDPFMPTTVCRVNTSFSFRGDADFFRRDIRTCASGDPLGALGDLGWYCIRLGLCAFSTYNNDNGDNGDSGTGRTATIPGTSTPGTIAGTKSSSPAGGKSGEKEVDMSNLASFSTGLQAPDSSTNSTSKPCPDGKSGRRANKQYNIRSDPDIFNTAMQSASATGLYTGLLFPREAPVCRAHCSNWSNGNGDGSGIAARSTKNGTPPTPCAISTSTTNTTMISPPPPATSTSTGTNIDNASTTSSGNSVGSMANRNSSGTWMETAKQNSEEEQEVIAVDNDSKNLKATAVPIAPNPGSGYGSSATAPTATTAATTAASAEVRHLVDSDSVPFDCEGKVSFGFLEAEEALLGSSEQPRKLLRERVLAFDCSFLLPLRQTYEICALNIGAKQDNQVSDKVIRCDDFVLPHSPNQAAFTLQTVHPSAPMTDRNCRAIHSIEQITTDTTSSCSYNNTARVAQQEVLMFAEFARIVLNNETKEASIWARLSMATQLICDACLQSMRLDGAPVAVDQLWWDSCNASPY